MRNNNLINFELKKGFPLRVFVITLVVFSSIIALMFLASQSIADDYDNQDIVNEEFSNKLDKFSEQTEKVEDMLDATRSKEGFSFIGTVDVLFTSALTVFELVFSSLGIAGGQIASIGELIGIPSQVAGILLLLLIVVITIVVVFRVIGATTNRTDI